MKYYLQYLASLLFILTISGCKKLIEIRPSTAFIVTSRVFDSPDDANAAVAGIFYTMGSTGINFSNAGTTIICGLSADELNINSPVTGNYYEFFTNSINSSNAVLLTAFWRPAYKVIYQSNAILTGLEQSAQISDTAKKRLRGEVLFARAFANFYLANYFGDIPLVNTINYTNSSLLARSSVVEVYKQIIYDLTEAEKLLPDNFNGSNGLRIKPTKWAARAFRARVYLYQKEYEAAEQDASSLIDNDDLFSMATDLNDVFSTSGKEAIWQIQPNIKSLPFFANQEAISFIPFPSATTSVPNYFLTPGLLSQFEAGDLRLSVWTAKTTYQSQDYIYPLKFKNGKAKQSSSTPFTECNTAFRLAEQYLIRAESYAMLGQLDKALEDINTIRRRAGLADITSDDQNDILQAIYHENRIEFFAEWGHRWFDLKRWDKANQVLSIEKGNNWQATDVLYPIPVADLSLDPYLVQNPGY